MSQKEIKVALDKAVGLLSSDIQTEYENIAFTPTAGIPYQQLHFLPAINASIEISGEASVHRGIYQITLKYPINKGVNPALDKVESIVKAFPKSRTLIEGNTRVICELPVYRKLGVDGDRYIYAVSIEYKSYDI